ncbi:unnamed protein product [Cyclocybe aegerita]|uniref:Uncharacterized protein n=1 Tax=Cyclocybe aegerita TaxID=1973307 RepID=A0A8S0W2K6_CYCAE|nr:unnamed protein product [Cyclocybe aegerita]
MRRFAKVFTAKKRDDKHVAAHTHSVASTASTPQPSIASDPAHSSASSSGSASVQTPDDDHHDHLGRADTKRSWKSWLAGKRTVSNTKQAPLPTQVRIEAPPVPDWHSHHLPSPFLHPAPPKPPPHPVPPDDSDEDESDHDHSEAHSFSPPTSPAVPIHPPTPGRARDNLRLLTTNALTPPPPVSPFIQYTNGPVFPRSTNRSSLLPRQPSTRVNLLKKQLLSSLDTAVPSSPNMAAIMPFASRPSPSPAQPLPSSFPDIARPTSTIKIFSSSSGVRAWVARPCFEERNLIYLANQAGGIDVRPISSLFAIAALEYSEHLDVMADPDFLSSPAPPENGVFDAWSPTEPTIPATESHARTLEAAPTSAPAHSRNSYTSVPSPLRNEHTPSSPKETTPAAKPVRRSSVKRVVRFAEDDSDDGDDGVPLHIVRMKKMREQKAKFLRQEQLKRAKEEEEERRRKEQEALEVERKRVAAEKEKREKEKALYAEAVTAARMRAETTRAGGIPSLNATTSANLLGPSPSFTSLRDSERNRPPDSRRYSARSPHDSLPVPALPRREASDPVSPSSYFHYPSDSSPTSSRPPSIGHSPVSPHSRPPSTYSAHTSSSEDVRQQSGSRRNSTTAAVAAGAIGMGVGGMNGGMGMGIGMGVPSMYGLPPMIMSYPTWTGSNPNLQYVPPVPAFPDFVQDMPLLPPTAPFMKQPYERRSSRNSSPGPSLSPSSRRGSFNSSTERVNAMSGSPASMSRNSSGQRLSVSASPRKSDPTPTSSRPTHSRRGSGDSRGSYTHHSAVPTSHSQHASNSSSRPPPPTTSRSQPVISRGRPPLPHPVKSSTMPLPQPKSVSPGSSQFLQAPSPWTALPSQTGRVPTAVPVSPYSHNLNSPPRSGGDGGSGATGGSSGRRQTVIS